MDIELGESADSPVPPEVPPTPTLDVHFPEVLDLLLPRIGIREKVKILLHEDSLLLYRRDYMEDPTDFITSLDKQELEEIVFEFDIAENEGLGVTIVGEQPVRVSRIFSNSPDDKFNIQPDDLIKGVNSIDVSYLERDKIAQILKNLSGDVSITVLRPKQFSNTPQQSDLVPSGWKIYRIISLLHASVSLYKPGSAVRLENGFCIVNESGDTETMLQCDNQESSELLLCVLSLKRAIHQQQQQHVQELNQLMPSTDAVNVMGWMFELMRQSPNQTYWVRRFVVCTDSQVRFFSAPPTNGHSWERCDMSYDLMTLSCHILKEKKSLRSNSFLLSSGQGSEHILSPETWDDLMLWMNTINSSTNSLIAQSSIARFSGTFENRNVLLEINFPLSIIRVINSKTGNTVSSWNLSAISQTEEAANNFLIIYFDFQSQQTGKPERIRIQLESVLSALHAIKSFIRAKVTESDPGYARTFALRSF